MMKNSRISIIETFQCSIEIKKRKRVTTILEKHKPCKSKCTIGKYTWAKPFNQRLQFLQVSLDLSIGIDRRMHALTDREDVVEGVCRVVLFYQFSSFWELYLFYDEVYWLRWIYLRQLCQGLHHRRWLPQVACWVCYCLLCRVLKDAFWW